MDTVSPPAYPPLRLYIDGRFIGGEGRVVQVPGCLEVVAIDQQLAVKGLAF